MWGLAGESISQDTKATSSSCWLAAQSEHNHEISNLLKVWRKDFETHLFYGVQRWRKLILKILLSLIQPRC